MQTRHEFSCHYCEADFIIETLNMSRLNYCPNCGTEQEIEENDYDEEDWGDDE